MKRRILKGCGRDLAHNFIRASGEQGFGRLRNSVSAGGGQNFTSAYVGQNFIKIGSEQNFISADRARNFNFINDFSFISAARNFTLALAATCVLSGCDGGSDAQDREQSARSEQNFSAGNQGRNFNKSTDSSEQNSAQNYTQGSAQNSAPQGFESKKKSDLNSTIDELANDAKVLGEALQNLQKKAPEVLNDFATRNADRTKDLLKQGEAAAREAGKNLDQMGQSLQGIIKDANESLGKVLEGFGVQPRQEPRGGRSQERDDNSDPEEAAGRQSFRI
ncbi:hypothetical protein [Campylobacter gracilis]|uniref:Uncharacterized protein n=1 Tax=Campylobacter gracilis RM3268 TaxID=553220 RepID=C8PK37_9BACT|nr:hypothetical protein [Campylobacter gracilis]AKT92128.1 hypothetical protein CGRAC_0673 [Campylobacter gracilis]EEV17292.1 hypothetical protein CAMGR0001_1588 [Campylobacter gracilis RM3268]UEB45679.1 hypothetical protein LK410_00860 [Campylobacter gracilis]SUW81642.1 Uncharacterised protein [Campylobacter gracilis]